MKEDRNEEGKIEGREIELRLKGREMRINLKQYIRIQKCVNMTYIHT